jgi:hypothetical protein
MSGPAPKTAEKPSFADSTLLLSVLCPRRQKIETFRSSPRPRFAFRFRLRCALNGQWKFQIATPQQSDGHTAEGNLDWLLPLMMAIPAWRTM